LSIDDLKELEPSLEVPADKFARFGDVLVNCLGEGTIGRVHFYAEPHQEWAVDQHMSICRAVSPTDSLYVYCALESPEGQARITSLKTGGTNMTMFNISALRSFAVVAPPAKLTARFAELTLPMLRQKQALTELNRNLRRTRNLLLPRLLTQSI
jgi:type I restriction enzyme S subunit